MQTANGDLTVDKETEVYIKDLDITVKAKLLPKTTSVLSMGKLVKDHDFKVTWTRDDGAIIENGKIRLFCEEDQNVPQLQFGKESKQLVVSGGSVTEHQTTEPQQVEDAKATQPEENPTQIDEEHVDSKEVKTTKKKKKQSKVLSGKCVHNVFTHFPKCENCEICRDHKTHRAYCRNKAGQASNLPTPTKFGEMLTADHKILNEDDESRSGDRVVCIIDREKGDDQFYFPVAEGDWTQPDQEKHKQEVLDRKRVRSHFGSRLQCLGPTWLYSAAGGVPGRGFEIGGHYGLNFYSLSFPSHSRFALALGFGAVLVPGGVWIGECGTKRRCYGQEEEPDSLTAWSLVWQRHGPCAAKAVVLQQQSMWA